MSERIVAVRTFEFKVEGLGFGMGFSRPEISVNP